MCEKDFWREMEFMWFCPYIYQKKSVGSSHFLSQFILSINKVCKCCWIGCIKKIENIENGGEVILACVLGSNVWKLRFSQFLEIVNGYLY